MTTIFFNLKKLEWLYDIAIGSFKNQQNLLRVCDSSIREDVRKHLHVLSEDVCGIDDLVFFCKKYDAVLVFEGEEK